MKQKLLHIFFIFILFSLTHCGDGTQVLSPGNPGESAPTALRTRIANYELTGTLPQAWTFQRLQANDVLPAGTYNDTDSATNLEAFFRRGSNQFSFFSFLVDMTVPLDLGLARFIRAEHPGTGFTVERDAANPISAYISVIVDPTSSSTHLILDAYYAVEGLGLLLHMDVSGSSTEIEQIMNEFQQLLDSLDLERTAGYVENNSVDRLLIGLCSAVQRCDGNLSAVTCLDAMDAAAGNQIWDQFGATWPLNSVSSNEVRQRVNGGTVTLQTPAYDNCLSELGLLCSDSFRVSAGADYMNASNLFSATRTPSCNGVLRN
ncbi:MAG: hypothetical protein HQM15_06535 [Deltaproteobacteria bacterium]|nr:hypothetical protein [Deltaproteobacteria bacterium]